MDVEQEAEVIYRPKTNCVLTKNTRVACDEYCRQGRRDFTCCATCGWNPVVAKERIRMFILKRELRRKGYKI